MKVIVEYDMFWKHESIKDLTQEDIIERCKIFFEHSVDFHYDSIKQEIFYSELGGFIDKNKYRSFLESLTFNSKFELDKIIQTPYIKCAVYEVLE